MRNTNLLALAAALILACVWAWASSTGTKAAAPTGTLIDPFQPMVSFVLLARIGDNRRQQLWGEPGSRAAAAGALLPICDRSLMPGCSDRRCWMAHNENLGPPVTRSGRSLLCELLHLRTVGQNRRE